MICTGDIVLSTIIILDIIHRLCYLLKSHDVSERIGLCRQMKGGGTLSGKNLLAFQECLLSLSFRRRSPC